jgi:hypothetical protein
MNMTQKTNLTGEEKLTEKRIHGHPYSRNFPSSLPHQDLFDTILKPEDWTDFGREPTEIYGRGRDGQWVSGADESPWTSLTREVARGGNSSGGS